MNKIVSQKPTAEENKQIQDSIRQSLLQVQQLRERIKEDQIDIEQFRAHTEAMLARLKTR